MRVVELFLLPDLIFEITMFTPEKNVFKFRNLILYVYAAWKNSEFVFSKECYNIIIIYNIVES